MRVVKANAKDLERAMRYLEGLGYEIELGPHSVLPDHSELMVVRVLKGGILGGYIFAHFITPYYRAELERASDDREYLRKLIEIKHSGESWKIPVDGIYIVAYDEQLSSAMESYSDDYPVRDGALLVEEYKKRNPDYRSVVDVILAGLLGEP